MLFSSITFLFLFLPIMLAVYYIAPPQWKNLLLLAGSLIFYAWGEPVRGGRPAPEGADPAADQ